MVGCGPSSGLQTSQCLHIGKEQERSQALFKDINLIHEGLAFIT